MAGRATLWLFWRCVLVATILLSTGCHLLFGGFEENPASSQTPIGLCDKGTFKCNEQFLLACDDNQWVKQDTCATPEQCDSQHGVCTICEQADMMRCSGATRQICSSDRSKWTSQEVCPSVGRCGPNGCGDCNLGDWQCAVEGDEKKEERVLKECVQGTTGTEWVVRKMCPNQDICEATMGKVKADPINAASIKCEPGCSPAGGAKCVGKELFRCAASGVDWMPLAGSSMCANEQLCAITADKINKSDDMGATITECDPGCGTAGTPRCDGNTLMRCDGVTWNIAMQCMMDVQCSTTGDGGCLRCKPGEYQCNGKSLQQCNASNAWMDMKDCKQPALCTVAADANGALTSGDCRPPACNRPGAFTCGTEKDSTVAGAALWWCDTDQTFFGVQEVCATPQLCNAADGKCMPPICEVGQRRCGLANSQEVQVCNAGRNGWDTVATCAAGEFCDPTDAAQPCKHECPKALYCNTTALMACSATQGVTQKAACATSQLCECGLNGTCPAGTFADGCGKPVCGGDLPLFRCTDTAGTATQGPILQKCNAARTAFETSETCGSAALCYPGAAPYYKGGYCATCPVAGEVACDGAMATHTCSTDRQSWSSPASCGFGCVVDASTMDYCAACATDERRCSGSQLLACSTDRRTLPVLQACSFGCMEGGLADYCAVCAMGEKRCLGNAPGSQLQTCNADRRDLGMNTPCANGCIDAGTNDYCADCRVGSTECSGAGWRECGIDGHWGPVQACGSGCVVSGGAALCADCAANERRCTGTAPGSTLQQCGADRMSWTMLQTCGDGCVSVAGETNDYCAACAANELRCSNGTLQQCSSDRSTLMPMMNCGTPGCVDRNTTDYCAVCTANELRCNGATLQTCNTDRNGWLDSRNCTNGCFAGASGAYCGECVPGSTQCATGGMQTCGTDGRWAAAVACPNGNACYGNAPTAYCGDCKPGDTQCSGSAVLTCNSVGHWPATATETCSRGCINSGDSDYCAECSPGDSTCVGSSRRLCDATTGRYATTGTTCDLGCVGTAPTAQCAVCTSGQSNCSGATARQTCANGQWVDAENCTNGCINSGTSDFCAVCPMGGAECVSGTSRRTCVNGMWSAPETCPNMACVGMDCTACQPGETQCAAGDPTRFSTCTASGTWGTPALCPNRACANDVCVDCMPGSTHCADATNLVTCSTAGSWGAPSPCSSMACVGTACADCQPGDMECVNSASQRVCNSAGHWVTTACADQDKVACVGSACADCMPGTKQCNGSVLATCSAQGTWMSNTETCMYGCQDNGDADFCTACPEGSSECVGNSSQIRTCESTWMVSNCMYGCFNAATGNDYCRDCGMGAAECVDDTHPRSCNDQGKWEAGTPCDNYCLPASGACVDCRPGSTMCQDAMNRLTCSEVGTWSAMAEECPNGCDNNDCVTVPP